MRNFDALFTYEPLPIVDIEQILQTELPTEDREVLSEDRERWKVMGAGAHLSCVKSPLRFH